MHCSRHPNTATSLSCGKCEQVICSTCMVSTSAGLRCPDCAYNRPVLTQAAPRPALTGMSAFAGLLTGLAGAYILALSTFILPIVTVVIAPLYGRCVADSVLSFSGDERGRKVEAIGVGSVLLGSFVALGSPFGASGMIAASGGSEWTQAVNGISVGLSVMICYSRLKSKPA